MAYPLLPLELICIFTCIKRSLQELSSVLLLPDSKGEISSISSSTLSEVSNFFFLQPLS